MNERIRQLAEQAEQYANEQNDKYGARFKTEYDKKFALLIVQECAEVADNADAMRQKWEGIGKYVRKHFGVEEK